MQKSKSGKQVQTNENQRAVLDMLIEDHRRIQELFQSFEDMDEDEEARRELVQTTCAELTVHAQLEEELFYPAVREEIDEQRLVDEAQVEHGVLKDLITQLEYTEPDDEVYAATFHVLADYANHHIGIEESEIFNQVRESKVDLSALAEEMTERRAELRVQHGLDTAAGEGDEQEEEEEEEEDDEGDRARKK